MRHHEPQERQGVPDSPSPRPEVKGSRATRGCPPRQSRHHLDSQAAVLLWDLTSASCRSAVGVVEQSAKPLPTARPAMTRAAVGRRPADHLAHTLVGALRRIMVCIVWQGRPQGARTTQHQLRQHFVLHRTDPSFGIGIQWQDTPVGHGQVASDLSHPPLVRM